MTTQNIKYYVSKEINQLEYDPNWSLLFAKDRIDR
jgi:hypothetical protein